MTWLPETPSETTPVALHWPPRRPRDLSSSKQETTTEMVAVRHARAARGGQLRGCEARRPLVPRRLRRREVGTPSSSSNAVAIWMGNIVAERMEFVVYGRGV